MAPLFGLRAAVPAAVRAALDVGRGDRVLAGARLAGGSQDWVVASSLSLHVLRAGTASAHGWDEVAQAIWSDTASMLEVSWADGGRSMVLEMAGEAGYLPEVVRERVEASVVLSRRLDASGRRGVRVAIRRRGHDGELIAQVVPDRGVNLADPELGARVAAELADLAEQAGMPSSSWTVELPRLDSNQRPSD